MKQTFTLVSKWHFLFLISYFLFSFSASAQLFSGEMSAARKNPHYLKGAVPVENGLVTFSTEIELPADKTADQTFENVRKWLATYFSRQDANLIYRKTLDLDSTAHYVHVAINKYLVFTDKALALDRTQFLFSLAVKVTDSKVIVRLSDISYYYEEERDPQRYHAEDWITDKACMNKKGTKLYPLNGKFRVKTIDQWDGIVASLNMALK